MFAKQFSFLTEMCQGRKKNNRQRRKENNLAAIYEFRFGFFGLSSRLTEEVCFWEARLWVSNSSWN